MSNYINQVSDSLKNHISELANNPCLFLRNPNVDFSRKRKIDFKTFIGIMMNSGGATMSKELLDFFDFNKNTPSVSAFTQQRSKVLPEAFEYLFKSFTDDNLPTTNNYHGYRLIACDGSNLTIATNQKDPETFWERNQHGSIVNKLHLNAFYDVLNRIYTDVLVQAAADYNEFRACATMIDRSKLENVILVADAPRIEDDDWHPLFVEAMEKYTLIEYKMDVLLSGSLEDRARLILDCQEEVKNIEQRIKEESSGRCGCTSGSVTES